MFESTKAVLFDLDGTVYYGNQPIKDAIEAIEHCRTLDKKIIFLTNNSTKTRQQIYEKLNNMGIECMIDEVISSGHVAALYAKRECLEDVFVCGSHGLLSECERVGIPVADAASAKNLLIGYDPDFNYAKLTDAVRVAINAKRIIACNKERTYLGENAQLFPGCGAMVAPIEWCSSRHADFVVVKPNTLMLHEVERLLGMSAGEMLIVGDTYESDIIMANREGCPSILVSETQYDDTVSISSIGELTHLLG